MKLFLLPLILAGCITTAEMERSAEENATEFVRETHLEVTGISCSGSDSDMDGYVSCTLVLPDGNMKAIECGYTRTFAWRGQNTACKVAMPLSIIQQ